MRAYIGTHTQAQLCDYCTWWIARNSHKHLVGRGRSKDCQRQGPSTHTHLTMIAFVTFNSSLLPVSEGLWSSNPWEFEFSGFRRKRTDDLGIDSPSLRPTEPCLHVRSNTLKMAAHRDLKFEKIWANRGPAKLLEYFYGGISTDSSVTLA